MSNPLGIRRSELGEHLGSEELARDLIAAGWIKPIIKQKAPHALFDVGRESGVREGLPGGTSAARRWSTEGGIAMSALLESLDRFTADFWQNVDKTNADGCWIWTGGKR
jgi:hypothetical protein